MGLNLNAHDKTVKFLEYSADERVFRGDVSRSEGQEVEEVGDVDKAGVE